MVVEETFGVAAPIETVFDALNDVGEIGYCVAGVKSVEVRDERRSTWKIEQRIGYMSRSFTLDAEITESHRPDRIAFSAKDRDVHVTGAIDLRSDEGAPVTRCELEMEIEVTGVLAPLVELFAKGAQEALIRETIANLRAKLEGSAKPASTDPASFESRDAPPPKAAGTALVTRLKAFFRRRP